MQNSKKAIRLYYVILALTAIALSFSDQIFSNYFKDVYNVDSVMRGIIEFPRESPGVLCIIVISLLSFAGDIRLCTMAQILSAIGLVFLGFFTPSFGIMLIFLFINSLGMHLFFPLQDSVGLSLIDDKSRVGVYMGNFKAVYVGFTMLGGLIVFFGFRLGFFSFQTKIKTVFLAASVIFVILTGLFLLMGKYVGKPKVQERKFKFVFKKEYKFYYILAIMNGVQKQIIFVYAPWILIEILGKKVDTIVILGIISSFLGIFFLRWVGKLTDKFGIKKMLYFDAISFIVVYILYGIMATGFDTGAFYKGGIFAIVTMLIFICDKLSMQLSVVRSVYLNKIALCREDITPTLSMGISLDHLVTMGCAFLGGLSWKYLGPQYIFFFTAVVSVVNLIVAMKVKIPE